MAGRARTKARALADALRAQGIDPNALITAAPANAPGLEPLDTHRAGAHARAHAPARGVPVGTETRRTIDQRTADDLSTLAAQLQPGLTVRLERTRPLFAAGHVEDVPIDDADLGALLDWLRTEHGGQLYRATVLATDGTPLYVAKIPIAGPPRRMGRVVPRSWWDGSGDETAPAPAPTATPSSSSPSTMADTLALFDHMRGLVERGESATLGAVREMVGSHQRQTHELLEAIFQRSNAERPGLRAQLAELAEASAAIEEIREVLGAPASSERAPESPSRSVFAGAIEQMAARAMAEGLQNDKARAQKRRAPQQQQGAQRPANFRRVARRPGPGPNGQGEQ